MPIAIAAAVAGLASAGLGIYQEAHAAHLANKNIRPEFNVDPAYQQNLNLDSVYAGQGLPTAVLNEYYKQSNRNFSQGVGAILQTGQGGNTISSLYGQAQDANAQIAGLDANAHMKILDSVKNDRLLLADQNNQAWLINKYKPYSDTNALVAQEKTAGIQNIIGGLNLGLSGFTDNATSKLYSTPDPTAPVTNGATTSERLASQAEPIYSNGTSTPQLSDYLSPFSNSLSPSSDNVNAGQKKFDAFQKYLYAGIDNTDYSQPFQYNNGYYTPTEY